MLLSNIYIISMTTKLPVKKDHKKINKSSFVELAKKVREILKKESEYAQKEEKKNENLTSTRFINFAQE